MMVTSKQKVVLAVILHVGLSGCFPVPRDDFDIPDVYSAVLPKYDSHYFKMELPDHPMVESVTSNVLDSLTVSNEPDNQPAKNNREEAVLQALVDLDTLGKVLDIDTKYIETRRKEDNSWPETLAAKIGSKQATEEEQLRFKEDLTHAISAVVIMKMMEKRLSFVNKYAGQSLSDHSNTELKELFGKTNDGDMIQGLFELKYFEGVLHSVNSMIDEALKDDETYVTGSPSFVFPGSEVVTPLSVEDDDITISILTFVMLLFTAVGFFFVLFLIIYLLLKVIRVCCENSSDFNKKSRYEQI